MASKGGGGGKNGMGKGARKRGVDSMMTTFGKTLPIGQEVRFKLIKGPSHQPQADPVDPKAPAEVFPLIAKFPESVMQPNFQATPWNTGRLYQQDVPKAQEDSDEEESAAAAEAAIKKRWRSRRKDPPKRRWVLQEQVDFLQTMMDKRRSAPGAAGNGGSASGAAGKGAETSTRYEGTSEHNTSQYIILEQATASQAANGDGDASKRIHVTILPTPKATVQFSQPASRMTLSMSQAEQAIEDQRGKTTRFFMQQQQRLGAASTAARVPTTNIAKLTAGGGSRSRLFGRMTNMEKLQAARTGMDDGGDGDGGGGGSGGGAAAGGRAGNANDDDDDDIMGDIAYRNRKGSGKKARKELLDTLGDAALKVDPDGVLGGANDSEFGRGMRFGRFQNTAKANAANKNSDDPNDKDGKAGAAAGGSNRGNDGLAMQDDFYQRDVQAEYEELDYDANEQFDDDDVDLGESEVVVDGGGFGGGDEDEEDDVDSDDMDAGAVGGAEGLASLAGLKTMLAKARGEITSEQIAEQQQQQAEREKRLIERARQNGNAYLKNDAPDQLVQIVEAAQAARDAKKAPGGSNDATNAGSSDAMQVDPSSTPSAAASGADGNGAGAPSAAAGPGGANRAGPASGMSDIRLDENGQRIIELQSVRREIWLNHGRIYMKRLMKKFDVKKRSAPERQNRFREVVKELCTMESDPINGRMLVLKQHYSNM